MNSLRSMASYIVNRLRGAWRRHCDIIRMTYELDSSSDRALGEIGVSRGDVADVAHGRFRQA